ncbi:MAG TPA: hypothetical protein VGB55_05935, partial [Tepidisphaeraceae bacterium]
LARIETMIKEGREKERIRAVRADSMAKPLAPPEPEWLALGTAVPPLTAKSEEVAVAPDPAIDPEISKLWETEGAAGDGMTSPEPTAPLIEEPRQEEAQQVTLDGVAVAIASDTLLTASSIVDGATEITVTDWLGKSDTATVIRTDAAAGLSLLRLSTIKAISLPVAATFAGGEVDCLSVNTGGLFQGETVGIGGTTAAPSENWTVSLSKSLKKSGAPLVSRGEIVGIALGTDNTKPDSVPAITRDELVRFIGKDAGKRGAAAKDPKQAVFHISVAR